MNVAILRMWRASTDPKLAVEYEKLLREEHFPRIAKMGIPGFRRIELVSRPLDQQVELRTLMWFDNMEDVRQYAGPSYDKAAIAPGAEKLLAEPDTFVRHFDVNIALTGDGRFE